MGAWGDVIALNRTRTGDINMDTADAYISVMVNHTKEHGRTCYLTATDFIEPVGIMMSSSRHTEHLQNGFVLAENVTAADLRDLAKSCLWAADFLDGVDEEEDQTA